MSTPTPPTGELVVELDLITEEKKGRARKLVVTHRPTVLIYNQTSKQMKLTKATIVKDGKFLQLPNGELLMRTSLRYEIRSNADLDRVKELVINSVEIGGVAKEKPPTPTADNRKWYARHTSWNMPLTIAGAINIIVAFIIIPCAPEYFIHYAGAGAVLVLAGFPFDGIRFLMKRSPKAKQTEIPQVEEQEQPQKQAKPQELEKPPGKSTLEPL